MLPPSDSQILRPPPACPSSFDPLSRRRKSNYSGSGPSESAFERCEVIHVDHAASWASFKLSSRLWLRQMRMNQMIEQLRRPVRARNQLAPLSVSRPRPVGRSIPSSPRSHVLPVSRPCRYPFRSPRGQQTRAAALRQLCRSVLNLGRWPGDSDPDRCPVRPAARGSPLGRLSPHRDDSPYDLPG